MSGPAMIKQYGWNIVQVVLGVLHVVYCIRMHIQYTYVALDWCIYESGVTHSLVLDNTIALCDYSFHWHLS